MFRRALGVFGAASILVAGGLSASTAATAASSTAPNHKTTRSAPHSAPLLTVAQRTHGQIKAPSVRPAVATGTLTRGVPSTISISTPNQDVQYSFAGTAGEHVTFDITASNWGTGTARLHIFKPGGVWVTYFVLQNTPTFGDLDLDVSGTWNIILDPQGSAVGSATIILAGDTGGTTLTRLSAVTARTVYPGQQARYAFAATNTEHVTFDISASDFGGGTARLYVFAPAGRYVTYFPLASASTYGDFDIDQTGTWKVIIDPQAAAIGSTTFTLAGEINAGTLQIGVPTNFAITYRGQRGRFNFASVNGHRIAFTISGATWTAMSGPGSAQMHLFRSSGSYVTSFTLGSTPSSPSLTSDSTSTWIGLVDPAYSALGSVTITLTSA